MIECITDIEYSRSKDLIDNGVKVKPCFGGTRKQTAVDRQLAFCDKDTSKKS